MRPETSTAFNDAFLDRFLPYQREWLKNPSRFKIGLWARQTGKDYTCAAEAVFDCAFHPNKHWLIVACGERQAMESLHKAREWANEIKGLIPADHPAQPSDFRESAKEIRFDNGSRITALPAKPETIRGDLHSIHRVVSQNGGIFYRATHSADGHSDRATALALALRTAEQAPVIAAASVVGSKRPGLSPRRST